MARPSEISTKTISFRIPMEDYLRFLTEATQSKLSLSEYMTLRIYAEDKGKANSKLIAEKDLKIKSLELEIKKTADKLNLSAQEQKKLQNEVTTLKKSIASLEAEKTVLNNKLKTTTTMTTTEVKKSESKISDLEKEVRELKAEKVKFEALKKELSLSVEKSKKVLAEHQKFVSDTVKEMEEIAKQKRGTFIPEVQQKMDKLKV